MRRLGIVALVSSMALIATAAAQTQVAAERGLNLNVWFNNVELVAAEKIGRETVTYVSNIYKCHLAYQVIEDERNAREKFKGETKGGAVK